MNTESPSSALADAYAEIESLRVYGFHLDRGLSAAECAGTAWPDEDSEARHTRVSNAMAAAGLKWDAS